ncbi:hypothetical protein D3H65_12505 [Paraflavitalea soli]|uniref:Protoporphyrinogen oxidase n=1 Tax=Paraflavitalea soli TaxID=2315862 RepID=A0A3B7MN71_9BACT|nr:NAD(P)/FAD-dependent oxidoreductase [Paraflavitalea soli]AXY74753.1 hypothetical protein D3H65_12505 [Paraflavitalea soli]
MQKKAIIIGAGPAGLTAAYELLTRTDIIPVILEKSGDIGGISKTVNYKGNRMDIGGHRFFSKSDRVMKWWLSILPLEASADKSITLKYQNQEASFTPSATDVETGEDPDKVMLVRKRLSRIYFLRKFFTYPISLSIDTLRKLGLGRTLAILFSYLRAQLLPRKPEKNLEDFMVNRFGQVLYKMFFRDYTEKVWGVPCNEISAEWGAQRIKGVSISKAIAHAVKEITRKKNKSSGDLAQKDTETSLIEQFLYPKLGPGQLWEEVARQVEAMGGIIHMHQDVKDIHVTDNQVTAVVASNSQTGESLYLEGDYFFSTMPIKDLVAGMQGPVPNNVREIAGGLLYRDFITVGILLRRMATQHERTGQWEQLNLQDNWIYVQDAGVKVGRLQLFHNWSPHMVADPNNVWIGMEFFCNETDAFWKLPDDQIKTIAISELEKIGLISVEDVLDSTVLRVEKTYPAYFGAYERFEEIKAYTNTLQNLFLVGRNGMHKYNNSDHSMLTAMVAVDNIAAGVTSKDNLWAINTEMEYHEEKKEDAIATAPESELVRQHQPALRNGLEPAFSFKSFLFHNKWNRRFLWFSAIALIIQFVAFKYFYPFANYIHGDSFFYILAASQNADLNVHLIGYSRFLRLFSVFSSSDTALVAFQYLATQVAGLFFLFSLFYFHKISRTTQIILLCFMVINPLFLHMANLISTDCIFLALSLTWFGLLLWIIHRPSTRILFWHALILPLAFTIRYNALVYPAIAALALLLGKMSWGKRIIGIAAPIILCGLFIWYTGNKYKALAGTWQFSPFSGWQAANNAMYTYRWVDSADRKPVPKKFKVLDNMIREYFDSTRNFRKYPFEAIKASTAYMWTPTSPLYQYRKKVLGKQDSTATELQKWAIMGPFYKEYGSYIIRQYPLHFAQHFLWPNAIKYYAPPAEFLEVYNQGKDSVNLWAQSWFRYKSARIKSRFEDPNINILELYPILTGVMNVVLLCCFVCFHILHGFKKQSPLRKTILIVIAIWLLNATFTIIASPAAIRLQAFPVILETAFALVLLNWLWQTATETELAAKLQKTMEPVPTEIPVNV